MPTELPGQMLLVLLALPAVAAVLVACLGPRLLDAIRWISLLTAVASLVLAVYVTIAFAQNRANDAHLAEERHIFRPELVTKFDLLPLGASENASEGREAPGIRFHLGLDGLNVWLVLLTTILFVPSVLISWTAVQERANEFYAWLLALQTAMMGIFLSFDIVLFYVFFEVSLVPLFFLIGIWGGAQKVHAARKFFIYTLTGSLITLLGVIGVVLACQARTGVLTFQIPELVDLVHRQLATANKEELAYWRGVQLWVFLALMAGFAVKVPLVPLHTWLPLAHVEAPTAGSVDLAGILLKVGAYGFLRLCVPLAPDVSLALGLPLVSGLAAAGIVYGAFCAYGQEDVKRLIAYSSVSHLGLCMLGMFALNAEGISGSIMQMINHGLSTGALFLLIGMLYERYHTRKIADYSGMAARLPVFAFFLVFICLSSVGLPGLNGFIGEVLCLSGVFKQEWNRGNFPLLAVIGTSGIILGAWYLITMLRKVMFGPVKEPHADHGPIPDLTFREVALIAPIALLCLVIGVYPQPILDASQRDVDQIVTIANNARKRAEASQHAAIPPSPPALRGRGVGGEGEGLFARNASPPSPRPSPPAKPGGEGVALLPSPPQSVGRGAPGGDAEIEEETR